MRSRLLLLDAATAFSAASLCCALFACKLQFAQIRITVAIFFLFDFVQNGKCTQTSWESEEKEWERKRAEKESAIRIAEIFVFTFIIVIMYW